MKNKKNKSLEPNYPTLKKYHSNKFLPIATAVGIGVSTAAVSLDLAAEETKVVETKETENKQQKEIKDQIILLAANLGHDDFKKREESTKKLISMGKKFSTEKKKELTKFLQSEVQKNCKSKDPEVKERAKKILLAIVPKTPPVNPPIPPRMGGVMIQKR